EVLGGPDAPGIDAEVIEMVMTFFERVGLEGVQLGINSIGDKNCRPKYVELLRVELLKVKDKLGPDSQRRIETNPLRVLDSKLESEQKIIEKLPRIADHLCKDCAEHYAAVNRAAKTLRAAGLSVELPPAEQKFGKALGQADKLGARYALILGDNEVSSGEWTLKTLATGEQQKLTEPRLLEFLKKL